MIRFAFLTMALMGLSGPTFAQSIQLRSGEHEEFSRLTLALPSRIGWEIEETDQGASIKFATQDLRVDTSIVFEKIPQDRVSGVSWLSDEQKLDINLGCDCDITGFWFGPSLLVLDIAERDEAEEEPSNQITQSDIELPTTSGTHATSLLLEEISNDLAFRTAVDPNSQTPDFSNSGLTESRNRLLTQFSRAASQGLLTPVQQLPRNQEDEASPDVISDTPDEQTEPPSRQAGLQINLRAESSIDEAFLNLATSSIEQELSGTCLPDEFVDVASWGTDEPFSTQIAAARLQISGELDDLDEASLFNLARVYLYFGFGAEAEATLELLADNTEFVPTLLTLSQIAELGSASEGSPLSAQLECDSPAALWSALSYAELPRDVPINTDAILRTFNALPLHLREQHGPTLSERFLALGKADISENIVRILERPSSDPGPEFELTKAKNELASGQLESAVDRLDKVVQSNSDISAEALMEKLDAQIDLGVPVTDELVETVAAYAFEKQNDQLGPSLKIAQIRALAASGSFGPSLDLLEETGPLIEPSDKAAILSEISEFLVNSASDLEFLEVSLSFDAEDKPLLQPAVGNALARRLLDLGFPQEAMSYVQDPSVASSPVKRERSLLRAELALAMNKPRQSLVELLSLDGPDVNALRAKALSQVGEYDSAQDLFASTGDTELARQQAWLGGDWNGVRDSENPAFDRFATIMEDNAQSPAEQAAILESLAQNRALVDAASQTREAIEAIIEANPVP